MFEYKASKILDYNINDAYEIIKNVEEYPNFIPWCNQVRIIDRKSDQEILVDLLAKFQSINVKYTSLVSIEDKIDINKTAVITSVLTKGDMKSMNCRWKLTTLTDNQTIIDFHICFSLKSKLLEKLMHKVFANANKKILNAFEDRVLKTYSNKKK